MVYVKNVLRVGRDRLSRTRRIRASGSSIPSSSSSSSPEPPVCQISTRLLNSEAEIQARYVETRADRSVSGKPVNQRAVSFLFLSRFRVRSPFRFRPDLFFFIHSFFFVLDSGCVSWTINKSAYRFILPRRVHNTELASCRLSRMKKKRNLIWVFFNFGCFLVCVQKKTTCHNMPCDSLIPSESG